MKRIVKDLKQFNSDGCTASPDFDFRECCERHDKDYYSCRFTRKQADIRLRECIAGKGYKVLPWIYYYGVRIFGGPHYNKRKSRLP